MAPPQRDDPPVSGAALAIFTYDLGFQIDLSAAEQRLREVTRHRVVRLRRPSPAWFDYDPPPLRLQVDGEPVELGACWTDTAIEALVYDFGAVVLTYRVPVDGPLSRLGDLSARLYDNDALLGDSRRRVEILLGMIREAVTKPLLSDLVEDYLIFDVRPRDAAASPSAFVDANASPLARILQSETLELSEAEAANCLSGRMAYSTEDLAVIDWNAALLIDREPHDVIALLQHANVELLELRLLDQQLNTLLDRSQTLLAVQDRIVRWPRDRGARELREFAELQTDGALLFEGVNNAIKLMGDQYLARLYRLAAAKLHLPEWDASVLRKLAATESVYQKITDANTTSRMELLEIVIILLIAISIVLPFVVGGGH